MIQHESELGFNDREIRISWWEINGTGEEQMVHTSAPGESTSTLNESIKNISKNIANNMLEFLKISISHYYGPYLWKTNYIHNMCK